MNKHLISVVALACFTVSGRGAEPANSTREVAYHTGDIVALDVQKGYVTLVELPEGEKAIAPICGDCKIASAEGKISPDAHGNWLVEALPDSNLVSITAVAADHKTDVHILASSGQVYSFSLTEVSKTASAHADMRVRLTNQQKEGTQSSLPVGLKYVSASTADGYKAEAEKAKRALKEQQAASEQQIAATRDQARQQIESDIRHNYTWSENKKAAGTFGVKSIYEVDGFTVIEAQPQESPALYEIRDGKDDSLIQFTLVKGKYVAPKIINDGYLRVGKSKLTFHREANNG